MTPQTDIKYFEGQQIRTVWDADEDKLYFSVVDVVQVLTEQPDYQLARNYWKVLKNRLSKNDGQLVTNCNRLKLLAADGKMRLTDVADSGQLESDSVSKESLLTAVNGKNPFPVRSLTRGMVKKKLRKCAP